MGSANFEDVVDKLYFSASDQHDEGRKFERLMKGYLQLEPKYADQFSDVRWWNEWPGRMLVFLAPVAASHPFFRDSLALPEMAMFIPFCTYSLVISDPESLIVQVFTYFPLAAPVTAVLRNGFGALSGVEASIVIAELFIVGALILRLAVHLFRYGSLEYGKKLSIAGIFRRKELPAR